MDKKYTVWVGGTEVTDVLVTYDDAIRIVSHYQLLGYSDVEMVDVDDV